MFLQEVDSVVSWSLLQHFRNIFSVTLCLPAGIKEFSTAMAIRKCKKVDYLTHHLVVSWNLEGNSVVYFWGAYRGEGAECVFHFEESEIGQKDYKSRLF